MLNDELPEGWLPHDGGPCPVDMRTRPGVKFRDGQMKEPDLPLVPTAAIWANPAGQNWWEWEGDPDTNIVAYRPGKPFAEGSREYDPLADILGSVFGRPVTVVHIKLEIPDAD